MKKVKKVRGNFNVRASTDKMLREYAGETQLDMSLVVDFAIVDYITRKRKESE